MSIAALCQKIVNTSFHRAARRVIAPAGVAEASALVLARRRR
jgi:hypothetical protein